MDQTQANEEKLREAACVGDIGQLAKLIDTEGINVNSRNRMNGWTALHWAAKRNHVAVVRYLLEHGADKEIKNNNNEAPAQLTNMEEIKSILGYEGQSSGQTSLPIIPNYISSPVFPYSNDQVNPQGLERSDIQNHSQPLSSSVNPAYSSEELVLKARVAYTDEKDFIEVEMDRNSLTFPALVTLLTRELGVDRKLIYKIRKLPNTILRKDKDVKRLQDFQELEVVLTNKAMSATSRGYGDFSEGYKTEQILY